MWTDEGSQSGGSGMSSSSLPSYTVGEGHRHLQQGENAQTTVDFFFQIYFSPFSFFGSPS
jgi:hypothetical protein